MEERIKYLKSLMSDNDWEIATKKYWDNFSFYARYQGNGIYSWKGILSSDAGELFLMGILRIKNIPFKEN